MNDDPPVPDDGTCVVCGEQRNPDRSAKYARAEAIIGPFCSSLCCRAWYGTTLKPRSGHGVTASPSRTMLRRPARNGAAVSPQQPPRPPSPAAA